MRGSLDQPPVVVTVSRGRWVRLAIGAVVLVAMGFYLLSQPGNPGAAILCIGAFGFGLAVGLVMLISPPRLEVGPSGVAQTVFWRTRRFAWSEIDNFRTAVIGLNGRVVGFDYLTTSPKGAALRKLNASIAGVQGVFQPGWEIAPQKLADLLNEARARWVATSPAPPG
jgi:hypothetical protein